MPQIVFRQNPVLDALAAIAAGRGEALKRKREIEAGAQYQADQTNANAIGGALGNIAAAPLNAYGQVQYDRYNDNRAIQNAMTRLKTLGPEQLAQDAQRLQTLGPIQTDLDVQRFQRFEPLYDKQLQNRLSMQSAANVDMTPDQLERIGRQVYGSLDDAGRSELAPQLGLSPGATPDAAALRTIGLNTVHAQRNNDARLAAIEDQRALQQAQQDQQTFLMATAGNIEGVPQNVLSAIQADYQKLLQARNDGSIAPQQSDAALRQFQRRVVGLVQPYTAATGGPRPKDIPNTAEKLQQNGSVVPGFGGIFTKNAKGDYSFHKADAAPESPTQIQYRGAAWNAMLQQWNSQTMGPPPVAPGIPFKFGGATLQMKFNKDTGEYETDIVDRAATKEPGSMAETEQTYLTQREKMAYTDKETGRKVYPDPSDVRAAMKEAKEYAISQTPEGRAQEKAEAIRRRDARATELSELLKPLLAKRRAGIPLTPEELQRFAAIRREMEALDRVGPHAATAPINATPPNTPHPDITEADIERAKATWGNDIQRWPKDLQDAVRRNAAGN